MAKKKNCTNTDLISYYMEYTLEHNAAPKSVYIFAKKYNFQEEIFYKYFGNFEALEQTIFKIFFDNTIILLEKSDDYKSYESRNKLLSFYYSFFELLTANRSYVVYALEYNKNNLTKSTSLKRLKHSFTKYIESLNIPLLEIKQEALDKIQNTALKETAWLQLSLTMKYWLKDTSPSFEKTDVFIEKSVNTSFDVLNTKPIKSIIDLGKFLYKDKTFNN
jgi:hypothetical protein|tara:strand:+ start:25 stop:681 length:657 start_codon:yes stop_codon:yes gene_type:complete